LWSNGGGRRIELGIEIVIGVSVTVEGIRGVKMG